MVDPRVAKMADVLIGYSLSVQPGERVLISGSTLAEPLIREAYRAVVQHGGIPLVNVQLPGLIETLFQHGTDEQLETITAFERIGVEEVDASLRIIAELNTRSMSGIAPERQRTYSSSRTELRQTMMRRAADRDLKWSLTLFPTAAHAQDSDMSLSQYESFVFDACFLDEADPAARWRALSEKQQNLIDWLIPRSDIHIVGPDTDLRLSTGGRTWINSDGKRNFPSGEVFTGPIESSAQGYIRFSYPAIIQGQEVSDIRLRFEDGKVVDASAQKNEEFFLSMLDSDDGARFIGEFAFGTNFGISRFTRNTLFDEKIGGTIHLALGAGYPDSGSQNQSGIHWDLICDLREGGEVFVDGDPFLKNGNYLVGNLNR